jgi:uncharacterized membrane protein YkvA (DUF1232 family)
MLRGLIDQVMLTWRLLKDPRVPFWAKLIPFAALLYVISPIDVLPDVLIGLGQLDDLGIVLGGMRLFEAAVPGHIVQEHRKAIGRRDGPTEVIDAPRYEVRGNGQNSKRG